MTAGLRPAIQPCPVKEPILLNPSRDIPGKTTELGADVIVMGTAGRVGIQGFLLGNTSETILQQVDCSGLTVKPPGFSTSISG